MQEEEQEKAKKQKGSVNSKARRSSKQRQKTASAAARGDEPLSPSPISHDFGKNDSAGGTSQASSYPDKPTAALVGAHNNPRLEASAASAGCCAAFTHIPGSSRGTMPSSELVCGPIYIPPTAMKPA